MVGGQWSGGREHSKDEREKREKRERVHPVVLLQCQ